MEKAGREEEEEETTEAVGPSRVKHRADEAPVKRGEGGGVSSVLRPFPK